MSAGGLVLCIRPCLCAHVICYFELKTNSFALLTVVFLRVFKEKSRVTIPIMLSMDDKLDEEDVLIIFNQLDVQNSPTYISFS